MRLQSTASAGPGGAQPGRIARSSLRVALLALPLAGLCMDGSIAADPVRPTAAYVSTPSAAAPELGPPGSASPGHASQARLAYVTPSGQGSFDLVVADPLHQTADRIESLLTVPALVIWRTDRSAVATVDDDGVYTTDYSRPPYVAVPAGDPPPEGVHVRDGWYASDGVTLQVVGWQSDAGGHPVCGLYRVPSSGGEWTRVERPAPVRSEDECAAFADAQRVSAVSVSSAALRAAGHAGPQRAAVGARLVLVEDAGQDPAVIDLDSGRLVFRVHGSDAVWLPEVPAAR